MYEASTDVSTLEVAKENCFQKHQLVINNTDFQRSLCLTSCLLYFLTCRHSNPTYPFVAPAASLEIIPHRASG